ncbi:hypothetical protein [Actinocorallia populi]|uniref:hypothetical protein n=1 Tax=Actinocorallia populi TaxID=2079200 RepID=UPI00130017CB|nr:hypothetical protein [Actinocorallia populi]
MKGRRGTRWLVPPAGLAALALYGYGRLLLPRLDRYGATRAEASARLPGDEMIPGGTVSTMGVTLRAAPERVWPWLAREDLKAGERVSMPPGGDPHLTVEIVDAPRTLVLSSDLRLPQGRMTVPEGPLPPVYSTSVRGYHLRPLPGGRTRLVVRTRSEGRPRALVRLAGLLADRPGRFLRSFRQFQQLHDLAERAEAEAGARVDEGPADARPSASASRV